MIDHASIPNGPEREIIIGMIMSSRVVSSIAAKWEKDGLFASQFTNKIAGWCITHFNSYKKAPRKDIMPVFDAWAEKEKRKNKAEVESVDRILSSLSDDLSPKKKKISSAYILDLARDHFNKVRYKQTLEKAMAALALGEMGEVEKIYETHRKVELGNEECSTVYKDEKGMKDAVEEDFSSIVEYEGALGEFFGDSLHNQGFIALAGPEKRGKCVDGSTLVLLQDGRLETIADIVKTEDKTPVISLNQETQRLEPVSISEFWDNGKKECYEVRTRTGRRVTTTINHEYLTPDGWNFLEDISIGDFIAVPKKLPFFGNASIPEDHVKFLGYMLADGGCTQPAISYTKTDPVLREDFQNCCQNLGFTWRDVGINMRLHKTKEIVNRYPEALKRVSSKTKVIPPCIFTCPKEQVALFLRVFFSGDGHISKDGTRIELTLANRRMIRQICHLLLRFGIVHEMQFKWATLKGRRFKSWRIHIRSQEYVNLFLEEINFLSYKHREPIPLRPSKSFLDKFPWQVAEQFLSEVERNTPDPIPASSIKMKGKGRHIKKGYAFREAMGDKQGTIREVIAKKLPVMRQSFSRANQKHPIVRKYMDSDILWDQISSIRSVGKKHTYDLTVPKNHNFVANDCTVHNTTLLLEIAHQAVLSRRNVVFLGLGDMSINQMRRRLAIKVNQRPLRPRKVKIPTCLRFAGEDAFTDIEEREFKEGMNGGQAWEGMKSFLAGNRLVPERLKLQCFPPMTKSVSDIRTMFMGWKREKFIPEVLVLDYADIIKPPTHTKDYRQGVNEVWAELRGLSLSENCLVVTATQTNRASYKAGFIDMTHSSEDKRKLGHVTGMVGLNQNGDEKDRGIMRLNWVLRREEEFSTTVPVYVAGSFGLMAPFMFSAWRKQQSTGNEVEEVKETSGGKK